MHRANFCNHRSHVDEDVCVIMITTEAEKRRVLEAIQAGVTDYLAKPFEAETLREKLQKHVGNQFALA
jgi:two-component system, chemotaxis family, chemotaxis protein CheY